MLGSGLNQVAGGENNEFGVGFWLLGAWWVGAESKRPKGGGSWSCGPGLTGLRRNELESGCGSGGEEARPLEG